MQQTSETIVFNGIKFRRYPQSKHEHLRKYFFSSEIKSLGKSLSLHQEVWKFHNGEIPAGHHIHHKDGNSLNNDISNLEAVPAFTHLSEHAKARPIDELRNQMNHARAFASIWHGSEEGKAWHGEHWKNSLANAFVAKNLKCQHCGNDYSVVTANNISKFCSPKCKQASARKSGQYIIERTCHICGSTFKCNKYEKTKTCSRKCSAELRKQTVN